jgi:hypothetical protein
MYVLYILQHIVRQATRRWHSFSASCSCGHTAASLSVLALTYTSGSDICPFLLRSHLTYVCFPQKSQASACEQPGQCLVHRRVTSSRQVHASLTERRVSNLTLVPVLEHSLECTDVSTARAKTSRLDKSDQIQPRAGCTFRGISAVHNPVVRIGPICKHHLLGHLVPIIDQLASAANILPS